VVAEPSFSSVHDTRPKPGIESPKRSKTELSPCFSQRGLPPARYVAVALEYLEPGEETNPATLERLRQTGTRFTLADAETKTLDVTLSNLP